MNTSDVPGADAADEVAVAGARVAQAVGVVARRPPSGCAASAVGRAFVHLASCFRVLARCRRLSQPANEEAPAMKALCRFYRCSVHSFSPQEPSDLGLQARHEKLQELKSELLGDFQEAPLSASAHVLAALASRLLCRRAQRRRPPKMRQGQQRYPTGWEHY